MLATRLSTLGMIVTAVVLCAELGGFVAWRGRTVEAGANVSPSQLKPRDAKIVVLEAELHRLEAEIDQARRARGRAEPRRAILDDELLLTTPVLEDSLH